MSNYGMKFTHQYDDDKPEIIMHVHREASLDEAIQAFEDFLRACGYYVEGSLQIVGKED